MSRNGENTSRSQTRADTDHNQGTWQFHWRHRPPRRNPWGSPLSFSCWQWYISKVNYFCWSITGPAVSKTSERCQNEKAKQPNIIFCPSLFLFAVQFFLFWYPVVHVSGCTNPIIKVQSFGIICWRHQTWLDIQMRGTPLFSVSFPCCSVSTSFCTPCFWEKKQIFLSSLRKRIFNIQYFSTPKKNKRW